MEAHAVEINALLVWAVLGLGSAGVYIVWWGFTKLLSRLDSHDSKLHAIETLLGEETTSLRNMMHNMDVRLARVEAQCSISHGYRPLRHDDSGRTGSNP